MALARLNFTGTPPKYQGNGTLTPPPGSPLGHVPPRPGLTTDVNLLNMKTLEDGWRISAAFEDQQSITSAFENQQRGLQRLTLSVA
jgi:hypothetical protein